MRLTAVFLVLLVTLVMVELSTARGRGGGGARGGSSARSRSRSSRTRSGSSSKPKITKNTPIKPISVKSPVIRSQTKLGSRSSTFKRDVVGYLASRYVLSNAPVYRDGYPLYWSYVSIPENRAVRISYEEEKLLDDEGKLCLRESNKSQTLNGTHDNSVELNTTVKYKNGTILKLYGVNNTVLGDIKGQNFTVTSRAQYNTSILPETNCTQVEMAVMGTMIVMYQTNPNAASQPWLFPAAAVDHRVFLPAVIALLALINVVAY